MFRSRLRAVNQQLEVLWRTGTLTGLSDAQLLSRFAQGQDATRELAFRELIDRHGPMVLGVCRQILVHSHDADDAFQATFLVLVRRARSIRVAESLAPWLYGVAHRTALRARAVAARYRSASDDEFRDVEASSGDSYKLDLRPLLYEELARLPSKYQAPIVLCHLEGKTHEEAARLLNWPVGTVSGRLSRGRRLLRSRLERRGVAVPATAVSATWLIASQLPPLTPLTELTVKAATTFGVGASVSNSVFSLTRGVLRIMFLQKLKTISVAVLLIGAITGGAGAWAHRTRASTGLLPGGSEPASISSPSIEAVPSPTPAPRVKPQRAGDAPPVMANDGEADCPVTKDGDCTTYCPISMAANALTKMFGRSHERTLTSK